MLFQLFPPGATRKVIRMRPADFFQLFTDPGGFCLTSFVLLGIMCVIGMLFGGKKSDS